MYVPLCPQLKTQTLCTPAHEEPKYAMADLLCMFGIVLWAYF